MNLELALRRACIADANLGRIPTELIVERQWGDGGNDEWTTRQVDSAIDPARVHDIDGERGIPGARARKVFAGTRRLEQQPEGIAAKFQIVTVPAHRRRRIEVLRPSARNLFGADEGRGADLGADRYGQRHLIPRR